MPQDHVGSILVLGGLLLLTSLAGCVEEEVSDPNVNLNVRSATVSGDRCISSDTMQYQMESGERCHQVTVGIQNQNQQEDLDVASLYWSAVGLQGAVFDAKEKTGPDAIAAGGQGEIAVLFAIPEGEMLQEIRYEYIWMNRPVNASIPSYGQGSGSPDSEGPEQASATASGVDLDDNGDVEWIKTTLTKGDNAPYSASEVTIDARGLSGEEITTICESADLSGGSCEDAFGAGDSWDVGENLWIPCEAAGNHSITVSLRGTTVLDTRVSCDRSA